MKFKQILVLTIILVIFTQVKSQNIITEMSKIEAEILAHENEISILQNKLDKIKFIKLGIEIKSIGLPALLPGDTVIEHSAMSLCYSEKHEQAKWVSHIIIPDIKGGGFSRTNDFREDSLVNTGTAVKADYWYSGYDRGHLAPSADFRWSLEALSESYLYSNMSPQLPELNREIWADLENAIREYVINKNEQVYVVTGGVLKDGLPTIGKENKISIPEMYYKVVLDLEGDTLSAIGFLIPNDECDGTVFSYAVSIDSVEAVTGIDFFASLPDSLENVLEAQINYKQWQVNEKKGNVLPISRHKLPKNTYNSVQARGFYDQKITVCGTVVAVHKSKSDNVFFNFDQKFPEQLFSCSIWKRDASNFSYKPEDYLINKKVCVTGIVTNNKGKPSMNIRNEKQIKLFKDMK